MPPTTAPMVDAVGGARRLQALACAGYGTAHLADLMVASRMHVKAWQQHRWRRIHLVTHERIHYTYQRLWDTDGPSTLARRNALDTRGWHPFEAWTDRTIDDPAAYPYGDPEAVNFVDSVLLARVRAGKRDYLDLSEAEKIALLAEHLRSGYSLRGFRNRYRPVPKRELALFVQRRPEIWLLFTPVDLGWLLRREATVADLRLVG